MALVFLAVSACGGRPLNVPAGEAAFPVATVSPAPLAPASDYVIGPLDTLSIVVFQEPDLSNTGVAVSLAGRISLPLIGEVQATGRTAGQIAADVASRLRVRYLRDPQVAVSVVRSANLTFTVDGQVKKPGVYEIPGGHLTLLRAVALGEGLAEYAKPSETVIIRTINGQRYAARFDLNDIRAARAPDPEIKQADVVVVGYSSASRLVRDIISALPGAAGIFVALNQ